MCLHIESPHKNIHQYITRNQLPSSVPAEERVKSDAFNYVVINDFSLTVIHKKKLTNITPNTLLVIPETLEAANLHIYHNFLLVLHQGTWETFLTMCKKCYVYNM